MDLLIEYLTKQEVLVKNMDSNPVYEIKLTRSQIQTLKQTPCPDQDTLVDMILEDKDIPESCFPEESDPI